MGDILLVVDLETQSLAEQFQGGGEDFHLVITTNLAKLVIEHGLIRFDGGGRLEFSGNESPARTALINPNDDVAGQGAGLQRPVGGSGESLISGKGDDLSILAIDHRVWLLHLQPSCGFALGIGVQAGEAILLGETAVEIGDFDCATPGQADADTVGVVSLAAGFGVGQGLGDEFGDAFLIENRFVRLHPGFDVGHHHQQQGHKDRAGGDEDIDLPAILANARRGCIPLGGPKGSIGSRRVLRIRHVCSSKQFQRFVPPILRLEEMFHGLTDRTQTTGPRGDVIGFLSYLTGGIGDRHRIAAQTKDRQIRQVITDHGRLRGGQAQIIEQSTEVSDLVGGALKNVLDTQFIGAVTYGKAAAPGDDRQFTPQFLPDLQPESIADVEPLGLNALVVEIDPAVRQDAIDVETDELDEIGGSVSHGRSVGTFSGLRAS